MTSSAPKQEAISGDNCIIVQSGRDSILGIEKSPPSVKLVRIEINRIEDAPCLQQEANIILKNNGDTTAFLMRGQVEVLGSAEMTNCNLLNAVPSLSEADWTYDLDLSAINPSFVGKHYLSPAGVANFNVRFGRREGSCEITVYKLRLAFEFDEGESLVTKHFFVKLSGPTIMQGCFSPGISPEMWAKCQLRNIKRLDEIGYDMRPYIHADSRHLLEEIEPNIFNE